MEILEDNDFQILIWDKEFQMMHAVWKTESENMTEEQYKTEVMSQVDWTLQNKAKRFLVDARKSNFVVNVEISDWSNTQYSSMQKYVKKSAIIRSSDSVANLSIELTTEEKPVTFPVHFFENETEAREWLLSV